MTPEGAILKLITDWLSAERIWWRRRNAGAAFIEGRKIGYGVAGDSDLEIIVPVVFDINGKQFFTTRVVFVECKAPKGKQSPAQKEFQKTVEALGCAYVLAYDLDSVIAALK